MKNFRPFLLAALVAMLCSVSAYAYDFEVDGIYYNVLSKEDLTCEVTCEMFDSLNYISSSPYTGDVKIPEAVLYNNTTYTVTSIGNYAFCGCKTLNSVIIPNSVTSIEKYAFADCHSLTSIEIPNSVTSIGDVAFYGCSGFTSVIIPNSVTEIGTMTFDTCTGLTSITIPNSVTKIGWACFHGCKNLTDIYIEDLAAWCRIAFVNYESNPCHCTHKLFLNNNQITDLVIPDSVTEIGAYAFYGCSSITSITIPNSVTTIGLLAFRNCTGLTSLIIPASVTRIGECAFADCTGLTSVEMPNSLSSIENGAFINCSGLTSVEIPSSVTEIGVNPFSSCDLKEISVAGGDNFFVENDCLISKDGDLITGLNKSSIIIPNSVTSIGESAFRGCLNITSIVIPNSVTSILYYAFDGCRSLKTIEFNATRCTTMGVSDYSVFKDCGALTEVIFGENVEIIPENAFKECASLTTIKIPESVTSIGSYSFYRCTSLTSVTVPNSVITIGEAAFCECDNLETVVLGNSVKKIGEYAIYNNYKLNELYSLNPTPPICHPKSLFGKVLKVPARAVEAYKAAEHWRNFKNIETIQEDLEKCAKPEIALVAGKIVVVSATPNSKCHTSITTEDYKEYDGNEPIEVCGIYTIKSYAHAEGFDDSETATALLIWVNPTLEDCEDIISMDAKKAVLIFPTSDGLSISGTERGESIELYNLNGKLLGKTVAEDGTTTMPLNTQAGEIVVLKYGEQSYKIRI